MAEQTISSLEVLEKKAGLHGSRGKERKLALKHYFSRGGIVRVNLDPENSDEWPALLYPTKLRLRARIREKEKLRANYLKKKKDWEKN